MRYNSGVLAAMASRMTSRLMQLNAFGILLLLLLQMISIMTNRKLHIDFRLVLKSMTLDDPELDGGRHHCFQILKLAYFRLYTT